MNFTVIIPARYQSIRLPGKPLIDIGGKPMVQRVYEQAARSDAVQVIVATDDERIVSAVKSFGGEVCLTREDHPSGTDRLQEVCSIRQLSDDHVVVNVQGDEPLIPPAVINQVANNLVDSGSKMATLSEGIDDIADLMDPNIVKVVINHNSNAMYFSRAPIPWPRDEFSTLEKSLPEFAKCQRHLGIYAYRVSLLNRFVKWEPSILEKTEKLEQLRALWHGIEIHVEQAIENIPPGIDTEKDLRRTIALIDEERF
ncbi:MAG: 3-deoxy-manno-octulosonate cytidylyltransferase [Gammaproteobacteria bacterium]|nr:3-deoxy-manno-octulosonate cytidylyltransferase [Gammaproteobacteria bacterium]